MLLLAIDTSTTAITVALHDGAAAVAEATTLDSRAHAEHLAPGIERVLANIGAAPTDVTDVVVGIGPGPFTGLRVGIVTGRTFAYALGIPVRGLCSLDALAHEAWLGGARGDLLVATDARRKELYAARYDLDAASATRVAGPVVSRPIELAPGWRLLPTVGRGSSLYPEAFAADALGHPRPDAAPGAPAADSLLLDVSAAVLADLAARRLIAVSGAGATSTSGSSGPGGSLQFVEPDLDAGGFDGLEPLYLRRPDAAPIAAAALSTKSTLG